MGKPAQIQCSSQMDRGLAYAEACFETFRVVKGEIFQWQAHWQRLKLGMSAFGLDIQDYQNEVLQYCLDTAQSQGSDVLLRLTVSGGEASWGLQQTALPQFQVQCSSVQSPLALALQRVEYPFALQDKFAKFTADYAERLRVIHRLRQQQPNIQAKQYLFCQNGHVLSGLSSNILILEQDTWKTPVGAGVLPGIVAEFLVQQGMVVKQPCPVEMLQDCQAILSLNCGQFMVTVSSIDGRILDTQHPATHDIRQALMQQQGVCIV